MYSITMISCNVQSETEGWMKRCVFVGILSCHYTAHTKFSEQSPFQGSCHTRSYARTRTRHKPQEHGCRDVACWLGSELPWANAWFPHRNLANWDQWKYSAAFLWLIHGSRSIAVFSSSCSLPSASLIWYIYMWYIYITWYYHDIYMCVCLIQEGRSQFLSSGGHNSLLTFVVSSS